MPAFGFGRAKKCEIEKTDPLFNPGPGQYIPLKKLPRNPTWKIGTAKRGTQYSNYVPGPGSYSMPDIFAKGPKYTMSSKAGAFDPSKTSFTPGPGQYYPSTNNRPSSVKYTMRAKPYPKQRDITPGPGNYNLRNDKYLNVPSYKFGNDKKRGLINENSKYYPGPGNYEYNADVLHEKHPKFTFGKESRGETQRYKTPGPGQYNYKKYIGYEGPKISMSKKFNNNGIYNGETDNVPGPGQYNNINANNYRPKTPAYKIGTAKRRGLYDSYDFPGPGQYINENCTNLIKTKNPAWKIGNSLRPDLNDRDKAVPGVGNYNITKGIGNGPKYSMVGKGNMGDYKTPVPGPGQYNETKAQLKKNPSWIFGTGQRNDDLKRVIKEGVPGPGMYEFLDNTKKCSPNYKFGREKKCVMKGNDFPGPGQYHIPCSVVDVNDYTREQGKFDDKFRYI